MAPAGTAEVAAIPMTGGAKRMLAVEVRQVNGAAVWAPYTGEPGVRALFEEVANQKKLDLDWLVLDPGQARFVELAVTVLSMTKDNSVRAILVIDPRCLANDTWRERLIALLQQPCRAGLLLPADANDEDATRLIQQHSDALKPAKGAPDWVVRPCIGSWSDLRTAVSSVADDMRARIVNTDPARGPNPPENDGPPQRPRIANR